MRRTRLAVILAALLAAFGSGCPGHGGGDPQPTCGPSSAVVKEVIDGDTIVLVGGEKVRYILVDAPETTKGHDDCYGHEAADFNASLVKPDRTAESGETVELRYDVQCRDIYNRLLAYVTIQGREINSLLVERGFACVDHIPPDGDDRVDEFEGIQAQAKAQKRGVWGACDPLPPACSR